MSESQSLTADEARDKAAECIALAVRTRDSRHKLMLEHMAEVWERIAQDIARRGTNPER